MSRRQIYIFIVNVLTNALTNFFLKWCHHFSIALSESPSNCLPKSPNISSPSSDSVWIDRPLALLSTRLLLLPCPHSLNMNRPLSSGLCMFVSDRLPCKLENDGFSSSLLTLPFSPKPSKKQQLAQIKWWRPNEKSQQTTSTATLPKDDTA